MQKFKVYFWKHLPKQLFKDIKIKYKDRLKDYMNIYVCETFEEMYNLTDKLEDKSQERNYGGRTLCIDKNYYDIETGNYVKTGPCCGHIIFNKEYFFMDTISHESSHAVIGYFNRKLKKYRNIFADIDKDGNEINSSIESEELFCYMVGNIGDQIVSKIE